MTHHHSGTTIRHSAYVELKQKAHLTIIKKVKGQLQTWENKQHENANNKKRYI